MIPFPKYSRVFPVPYGAKKKHQNKYSTFENVIPVIVLSLFKGALFADVRGLQKDQNNEKTQKKT